MALLQTYNTGLHQYNIVINNTLTNNIAINCVDVKHQVTYLSTALIIHHGFRYTIMLTYHCAMSYPLSTYLEYCFLVPQGMLFVTVYKYYNYLVISALVYCA